MELEIMGFDLTRLAFVVMGNFSLIAIGVSLVAYFEGIIKKWKEEEAVHSTGVSEPLEYQDAHEICQAMHSGGQDCFQGLKSQQLKVISSGNRCKENVTYIGHMHSQNKKGTLQYIHMTPQEKTKRIKREKGGATKTPPSIFHS